MANLFNSANAPLDEPLEFVKGDFVQWRQDEYSNDYPNTSHTMEYVARIKGGGSNEIKVASTTIDDDYLFTISSSTSGNFETGNYHWQLEVIETSSSNRIDQINSWMNEVIIKYPPIV